VTVRAAGAPLSADFRYVTTREGTGTKHWVVLLDLAGRRAHYVAEVEIAVPPGSQAAPAIAVSPSADGRAVLLAATEPAGRTQLFHLAVEPGQVRALRALDQFTTAVLSPDGSRFAFTDLSVANPGLWVDTIAGGAARRVIASSPLRSGGPARPVAFSPDGTQLAAVVTFGPGDNGIALVATTGTEARINDQARSVEGAVLLERGTAFDWRGAPGDAWAWEGADASGGSNAVNSYDTRTAAGTLVYRPGAGFVLAEVQRSPRLDRFATLERAGTAHAAPGAVWVRTRAGGATKAADVDEAGPRSVWWSPDGARLYAIVSGDDSVAAVVDVLTGEAIVTYCVRNAGPGCV
jgi:Tol biopolymer transport system component